MEVINKGTPFSIGKSNSINHCQSGQIIYKAGNSYGHEISSSSS